MRIRELLLGLVNFFVAIAVGFLAFRFVLKLFGANAENGFVNWLYNTSGELLDPFRGIFPVRVVDGAFVVEFSTIFAIIVYMLAGLLVATLIDALTHVSASTKKK